MIARGCNTKYQSMWCGRYTALDLREGKYKWHGLINNFLRKMCIVHWILEEDEQGLDVLNKDLMEWKP